MRLGKLRDYVEVDPDVKLIDQYLSGDHRLNLRAITQVLSGLSFSDNFKSWTAMLGTLNTTSGNYELAAGIEFPVVNQLGLPPSARLIVGGNSPYIADG